MNSKRIRGPLSRREAGSVLVTASILLVCLVLLGLGIVNMTTSEEKVARNARDADIAFAAAEAALRDAELHVGGSWHWPYTPVPPTSFDQSCTAGLCDSTTVLPSPTLDQLDFYASSAPASNSIVLGAVTGSPAIAGILPANQPRYIIEMLCSGQGSVTGATCNKIFRITAQARGRLPETRVILQEMYSPQSFAN